METSSGKNFLCTNSLNYFGLCGEADKHYKWIITFFVVRCVCVCVCAYFPVRLISTTPYLSDIMSRFLTGSIFTIAIT